MSRLLSILLLCALAAGSVAHGKDRTPMFADRGTALKKDPYLNGSGLTEGRIEGFRKSYVPDTFLDGLNPAKPPSAGLSPVGDLPVANPTSAWADVKVNGEMVGRIGPFREGVLHDVRSGVYTLEFTLPTGQVIHGEAATRVPEADPVEG